jgi:hypothetical protein
MVVLMMNQLRAKIEYGIKQTGNRHILPVTGPIINLSGLPVPPLIIPKEAPE